MTNPAINRTSELLNTNHPVVMGILNVTPDSFFNSGKYQSVDKAVSYALTMEQEGADIIDIGGESTRPGAQTISVDQELERVMPVIEKIQNMSEILISVDTSKTEVMREAINAGASFVNDVKALKAQGAVEVCAKSNVTVCLMHMQGKPESMQQDPEYLNVVDEVKDFLLSRANKCISAGIDKKNIIIDPGFGFGKTLQHNLSLLNGLHKLSELNYPVLIGVSRKSMLGDITDKPVDERESGGLAAAVIAYQHGAKIFRVHDVASTKDALLLCEAVNDNELYKNKKIKNVS